MAQKGGIKLRRSSKDKGYYERQYNKTANNKLRRAIKRKRRANMWEATKAAHANEAPSAS